MNDEIVAAERIATTAEAGRGHLRGYVEFASALQAWQELRSRRSGEEDWR